MISKILAVYLIIGCLCALKIVYTTIKRREVSMLVREHGLWAEVIYIITWVLFYPVWFIGFYIEMTKHNSSDN